MSSPRVLRLRAERTSETFVATRAPRLSWVVGSEAGGWLQQRAEVELADEHCVRTAMLEGDESVWVDWPFDELEPGVSVRVRVRVTGHDGIEGPFCEPLEICTPPADFGRHEHFVTSDPADLAAERVHQLWTRVDVPATVRRAVLAVSALGAYEPLVNGHVVGDEHLAPGWTAYEDRLLFRCHDVTSLVDTGENWLGAWLGPGWFGERYGFFGRTSRSYVGPPALVARLEVQLQDGTVVRYGSDESWWSRSDGHGYGEASIYHGETVDLRLLSRAWEQAGAPDAGWRPCVVAEVPDAVALLTPSPVQPVRTTELRTGLRFEPTPAGRLVADVGENVVGVARVRVAGPAGHTVTLRFAEELHPDGEPAYGPLRTARATDRVTLAGAGVQEWAPRFTFHGFRYVELIDWPADDSGAQPDVTVEVWRTDAPVTGTFECSDELVSRLWRNTVRSLAGNIVSLPTDCPQRDERLGWTGDLQVFAPAACSMMDVSALFASWLQDVWAEQARAGGCVPVIVPNALSGHDAPVAGWGDVATVAPWTLHERFGDRAVLREQWPSMRAWVDVLAGRLGPTLLWDTGMQIGDHLAPARSDTFPGSAPTDPTLLATAYVVRSARIVADAARLLGHEDDAAHYGALAEQVRVSFVETFVSPRGRTVSDSITSYCLSICFDLVDEPTKKAMGQRLSQLVAELDFRIGTGFLGTPLLMDALTGTGQMDTAARLLTQTDCPSWLYPVTLGATTIWERWDLKRPDGSIVAEDAASANHYALGAVTDWLQRRLAGLAPAAPGYRRLLVDPCLLPGFTHASTSIETPYGRAAVAWRREDDHVHLAVDVAPNTTALVRLPGDGGIEQVGSGRHTWEVRVPRSEPEPLPTVSLATPLERLVRDREARAVIVDALHRHDPHRAGAFTGAGAWRTGVPLEAALMFVHPDALSEITRGLADLSAARGHSQDG